MKITNKAYNYSPTGDLGIIGELTVGRDLRPSTYYISDRDGISPNIHTDPGTAWQWQRLDLGTGTWQDIEGGTSYYYRVTSDDAGHQLRLVMTYTDYGGTFETVTSAATKPVTDNSFQDTEAQISVTITGTPIIGETVTVTTSVDDADGEVVFQEIGWWYSYNSETPSSGLGGPSGVAVDSASYEIPDSFMDLLGETFFVSVKTWDAMGGFSEEFFEIGTIEPYDDVPGEEDTQAALELGQAFSGDLEVGFDWDWFGFDFVEGQNYSISMLAGTLWDPYVSIANASGDIVFSFDGGSDGQSEIFSWVADFSGPGFVIADSYYNNLDENDPAFASDYGTYELKIEHYGGAVGQSINGEPTAGQSPWVDSLVSDVAWGSDAPTDILTIKYTYASGLGGEVSGVEWDEYSMAAFERAISQYEAIALIDFVYVETISQANMAWWLGTDGDFDGGTLGWHYLPSVGSIAVSGAFNTDSWGWTPGGLTPGGEAYATVIHEIGHGLGLLHPHDADVTFPGVTAAFDDYGDYNLNQGIWTTMSYNSGWPLETNINSDEAGLEGSPMALDVAAIQSIYGANENYKTGDDKFLIADVLDQSWVCIWDAGGEDTISGGLLTEDLVIDLRAATLVDDNAGGFVTTASSYDLMTIDGLGGYTIANGVCIENAEGSFGDDWIIGNEFSNKLSGKDGNDRFKGSLGDDIILGGFGIDTVQYDGNYDDFLINASAEYVSVSGQGFEDRLESIEKISFNDFEYDVHINTLPTGEITINGSAKEGETLSVASTVADGDGVGAFSYQWFSDGNLIEGATSDTLELGQNEVGRTISVVVSYLDGYGTLESVSSVGTSSVLNVNDAPVAGTIISGNLQENALLSANGDNISDDDGLGEYVYQWLSNGIEIEGATSDTFKLTANEVGTEMSVAIRYTDFWGTDEEVVSYAGSPVEDAYVWRMPAFIVNGAETGENVYYTDAFVEISLTDSAQLHFEYDDTGTSASLTQQNSGIVITYGDIELINDEFAQLEGSYDWNILRASFGDEHIDYIYWDLRDHLGDAGYDQAVTFILGKGKEFVLETNADVANELYPFVTQYGQVDIYDEFPGGNFVDMLTRINSLPSGGVTISGIQSEYETIYADTSSLADEDGLGSLSYQWFADGEAVLTATNSSLYLDETYVGREISVSVSYIDGLGALESVTSAVTAGIANVNDSPTGVVEISGTPQESQVLTLSASLEDLDGLGTFSYQWFGNGVAIEGATGATFTLGGEHIGQAISGSVSYTDGYGMLEVVTSAETAPVEALFSEVTSNVFDRFGNEFVADDVYAFEASSGDEFYIREVGQSDASTEFEIVVSPTSSVSAVDFTLEDFAGLGDFTLSDALDGWVTQVNSTVADKIVFGGFGAVNGSNALASGQETVIATFTSAENPHLVINGISLDGAAQANVELGEIPAASAVGNVTTFEVSSGSDIVIGAAHAIDGASEDALGAFDALQALRLAVGLTKSDGTAEWHDFIAADINQDGRVGADDALNILKAVVGIKDGPAIEWVFVDSDADWSGINSGNTDYDEGVPLQDVTTDVGVSMTAILLGDVDGSYLV